MYRPNWMSDPAVADIPQEKLDFLAEMFEKVKGKSQKELLPFFMAMSAKSPKALRFTTEEMQAVITAIKRASSEEEQHKIDHILHMAEEKAKKQP